jgi:hypothetical protein
MRVTIATAGNHQDACCTATGLAVRARLGHLFAGLARIRLDGFLNLVIRLVKQKG